METALFNFSQFFFSMKVDGRTWSVHVQEKKEAKKEEEKEESDDVSTRTV